MLNSLLNSLFTALIRPLEALVPKLLDIFTPYTSGEEPNPNPHPALAELASVKLRALESYNSLLQLLDVGLWEVPGSYSRLGYW